MGWNKINMRAKEKNLPPIKKRVLWGKKTSSERGDEFSFFIGFLEENRKNINTGIDMYKITSNFWWMEIEPPKI